MLKNPSTFQELGVVKWRYQKFCFVYK